jgi:hypothetical protein
MAHFAPKMDASMEMQVYHTEPDMFATGHKHSCVTVMPMPAFTECFGQSPASSRAFTGAAPDILETDSCTAPLPVPLDLAALPIAGRMQPSRHE